MKWCYLKNQYWLSIIAFIGVFFLFFDVKYPLHMDIAYILGEKKDFTINFLYISDIFIIIAFLYLLVGWVFSKKVGQSSIGRKESKNIVIPYLLLILAIFSFFINFNKLTYPIISIFFLLNIAKAIVLHETLRRVGGKLWLPLIGVISFFGLIQACIGIFQFISQASIGFTYLEEPKIAPYLAGVAKVEALGQVFIRAYGTLLHPNILSCILVITLICLYYLYFSTPALEWSKKFFYILGVQIVNFALFLSFSRAGWLAGAIVLFLIHFFTWNIYGKSKRNLIYLSVGLGCCLGIIILTLYKPFIIHRENIFDKAYKERVSYNRAGAHMVQDKPLLGMGPGESVLHMEQYLGPKVQPWEVQPIHNYYLLLAAEIGVPALLLFVYYLITIARRLKASPNTPPTELYKDRMLLVGIAAFCILMIFDHYLYTSQATLLLFWGWLGMAAGVSYGTRETQEVL